MSVKYRVDVEEATERDAKFASVVTVYRDQVTHMAQTVAITGCAGAPHLRAHFGEKAPEGGRDLAVLDRLIKSYTSSGMHAKGIPAYLYFYNYWRLSALKDTLEEYNTWRRQLSTDEIRLAIDGAGAPELQYSAWRWQSTLLDHLKDGGYAIALTDDPETKPAHIDGLAELVEWLSLEFKERLTEASDLLKEGRCNFDGLAELFRPGQLVTFGPTGLGGERVVMEVITSYFQERSNLFGKSRTLDLQFAFVGSIGDEFALIVCGDVISPWTDAVRPVSGLPFQVLPPSERAAFIQRGRLYERYATGSHFVAYERSGFVSHAASRRLETTGRMVVDTMHAQKLKHTAAMGGDPPSMALLAATARAVQQKRQNAAHHGADARHSEAIKAEMSMRFTLQAPLPDDMALLCWPAVAGFSISAKVWGHCSVSALSAIEFEEQAFDQLVLTEERKDLIQALVVHGGSVFTDILSGKGGGSIFLLHGPPGVGKTLTAEALAERLHRPLYVASMGELGTTADQLEERLGSILQLCAAWDAILLLDEADVFLERREKSELARNALVCVMLRLLEYHRGIIFLTSNRATHLDPAVRSRVTLALAYPALSTESRAQIWRNLLAAAKIAGVADEDIKSLAVHPLNGRQVKNAVRLAQALAAWRKQDVNAQLLQRTVDMQLDNFEDVEEFGA